MVKAMRIGITGASGLIGSALTAHFTAQGHTVISCSTRGEIDLATLEKLDALINLAGESLGALRWNPAKKQRIRDSRVQSTQKLVTALNHLQHPPSVLISASAVGYYGADSMVRCTEESPPGKDFLASVCRAWEEEAHKFTGRVIITRLGIVLAKEGGALPKLLSLFKWGFGGRLGTGKQMFSWIALADVIKAIDFLLHHTNAPSTINLCAPSPINNREFTHVLAQLLKRPAFCHLPACLLKLILGEVADAMLLGNYYVSSEVLRASGFSFSYPSLEKALEPILFS